MTVTYTGEVATCTGLGCFWKLLFRWRGSIYKLLWPNLIVYSVLYFTLSAFYRFILSPKQRTLFEKMALHCQVYGDLIPVSFVLGFYVSLVIKRWWDQYLCLPWPDNLALFVSSLVHGQDDRGRMMRRTIMRYVNLSLLLTLRMISPRVKKRFPTLDHVVDAGWMLAGEKKIFEDLEQKTIHAKYWMPLVWAGGIVTRARKESRIKDDFALKTLIDELNTFRGGCGGMLNYDWISIPLVYTQVVTLAVYVYFLATLMGNQFLDPAKNYKSHQVDLVMPVFTFLQFFFYMGWLKVAESLVNPFGEDDDDFEVNWLLDRNLQISYVIVDEMHQEHPEMLKDQYWDEIFPVELPYTAAAKQYHTGPPLYSAEDVEVPLTQAEFMPLDSIVEGMRDDDDDDDEAVSEQDTNQEDIEHPSVQRGETHPMRIRRRSRSAASSTNSPSVTSASFTKGRNSVLNLLSKIFNTQDDKNKEDVTHLGSSMSLRSRWANRSTSRISSVSYSMAPSRSSIARDGVPDNDYQEEVFSMSDIDLPDSSRLLQHSQTSIVASACKPGSPTLPSEEMFVNDVSPPKYNCARETSSPKNIFHNEYFTSYENKPAKVILQSNSPVYHVFTPEQTTPIPTEEVKKIGGENLITILPPLQRFTVEPAILQQDDFKIDILTKDVDKPELFTTTIPLIEEPEPDEQQQPSGLDPTTPSPAIPVPSVSQAHVKTQDIDSGATRRLEPIIEHRDEGSLSSSCNELQVNNSRTIQIEETS